MTFKIRKIKVLKAGRKDKELLKKSPLEQQLTILKWKEYSTNNGEK